MIHSHPGGERCFYYFPGTQVPSSDAQSFGMQAYPVDAILCGDSIVWINRAAIEQHFAFVERRAVRAPVRRQVTGCTQDPVLPLRGE